jgi:hypothetical protein
MTDLAQKILVKIHPFFDASTEIVLASGIRGFGYRVDGRVATFMIDSKDDRVLKFAIFIQKEGLIGDTYFWNVPADTDFDIIIEASLKAAELAKNKSAAVSQDESAPASVTLH